MDETLQDLENELKRLTPRRPSAPLMAALGREFGVAAPATPVLGVSPATISPAWKWASWSLAAAAVVAFGLMFQFARRPAVPAAQPPVELAGTPSVSSVPSGGAPTNRYVPVQATSVLYDLREDGAATLADQSEGRQVRYRYVDTYTWKNPATNASLRWSVPRDEVRVIRASLD